MRDFISYWFLGLRVLVILFVVLGPLILSGITQDARWLLSYAMLIPADLGWVIDSN